MSTHRTIARSLLVAVTLAVLAASAWVPACAPAPDFAECVAERARCRTCRMFNSMSSITADCDLVDDATPNASCQ